MTPQQKIKYLVLAKLASWDEKPAPEVTADNIDDLYEEACDGGDTQDARYAIREGEVETRLSCPLSRHYECKSVAARTPFGWVGWDYWYSRGKHGEPGYIDWVEDAYHLDCQEEEKMVVVRTFTRTPEAA